MSNVLRLTKDAFTWSVVVLTILWSMGVAALVPLVAQAATCPTLNAGDLFKVSGNSAVYLVNPDMKRMYFPNSEVYHSWYENFSGVQTIANTCVDNYPSGGGVNYRPGSQLIKVVISPNVYAVGPDNMKHKIASEAVAKDLYGADWAKLVRDLPDVFDANYSVGAELKDATPHNGQLVKKSGDSKTYHVVGGKLTEVSGSLSKAASGDVRTLSATTFAKLEKASGTATAASVLSNPSQKAGGSSSTTKPTGPATSPGAVTVALAADTPAAGYALKNATRVGFTKFNLTAGSDPVTIKSLKIERTGSPASDGAFTGVNIMKPNGDLLSSSYKTLNSDHQATFTEDIVVPANSTVSYTLVGKIVDNTTYSGEVPTLTLVSLDTDATVSGSLPLVGNAQTINTTVNVADLTVAEGTDVGANTEEVGTVGYDFTAVKLTNSASNADLQIESIKFNNAGSADDGDIDNASLVIDGEAVATASMDKNYIYFDLSKCGDKCKIEAGKNETFTLRADIIGGSGRTLDFDIKRADDIVAKDLLNNVYVTPSGALNAGNIITVSRGTLTVSKTNTVAASNIPSDTTDLELGSWNFKVEGEPITVSTIKFDIDVTNTVSSSDFTSLKLYNKTTGATLTGGTDGADASTSSKDGSVSFTDSFTLPIGNNEIILKGNLSSDAASDDTVQFAVDFTAPSTDNLDATGNVTGDAIALSATAADNYANPYGSEVDANLLTVKGLSLDVVTLSNPAAQTIAAGSAGVHFSTVSFDATDSSEDIKVTQFHINVTTTGAAANELQNIKFQVNDKADGSYRELGISKNGTDSTSGSDERINVALTGSDQFIVKKGTKLNLKVYVDLSASATANGTFQIQINNVANSDSDTTTVTSQGVVSGNDITETYDAATGSVMTVGTAGGNLEVSLDSSNPTARLFAAGTEVTLGAFNFYASNTEDIELDYMYLTQVVTTAGSSSFKDYDEIWFVDEAGKEIAGTRTNPTSTVPKVDFSDDAFIVNIDDTDGETLYLKAKLAAIGNGKNGTAGNYLGYKVNAKADVVAKGNLTGSGTYEFLGSSANAPTGNTHYGYKGYPVVTIKDLTSKTLTAGDFEIFRFEVAAVNSDIALYGFTFDVATTVVTVRDLQLYKIETNKAETIVNDSKGDVGPDKTWQTVGTDWTSNFASSEINVSKSTPVTFSLKGNVSALASGAAVTVKLAGDAAHLHVTGVNTVMGTAANVDADVNDDFIWSDKSADGHSTSKTDWTNGFLVSGLPATSSTPKSASYTT